MPHISSLLISNVKKSARKIQKERGLTYMQALDISAQESGFSSYHVLNKKFNEQKKQHSKNQIHINSKEFSALSLLKKTIILQPVKDGIEQHLKHRMMYLSQINNMDKMLIEHVQQGKLSENYPLAKEALIKERKRQRELEMVQTFEEAENTIYTLYNDGIEVGGKITKHDWPLINNGISKEFIKKGGYEYRQLEQVDKRMIGYHLLAFSHFFRSAAACFGDGRDYHANFKTYMSDWISATGMIRSEDFNLLREMYPENATLRMSKGTSYWK